MQDTVFSRSSLANQTFPGGMTYEEYLAAKTASGEMDELKAGILPGVRSKFLEYGLSGETYDRIEGPVDLNTYFGSNSPVFLQSGAYDAAKEAYKREQDGTATQQDLDLLAQVRDPDGPIMKRINSLAPSDPAGVLQTGYLETGGFPQNLMTGEIELFDEIKDNPSGFDGMTNAPELLPYVGGVLDVIDGPTDFFTLNRNRREARVRSEQALELQNFLSTNVQTPRDPVIRQALDQVINADVLQIVAERLYNLADMTEEGVEHYLPRLTHWATRYAFTSENTFGILSAENFLTEEDVTNDLMQVRALSGLADRSTVLNDLLRKQVRDIVGEEAFNESIYAIKDEVTYETADGKTVTKEEYRHNFVSESFAEQFFEATLNSKSFLDKFAVFVLENLGAGYAVRVPFAVAGNAVRATARLSTEVPYLARPAFGTAPRYLGKDGSVLTKADIEGMEPKDYMTLPYSAMYMDTADIVKYTEQYAQFAGIPFSVAAKQLQRQTRAESMLVNGTIGTLVGTGPLRGGRLTAVAESGQTNAALREAAATQSGAIKDAKKKLIDAIDENNNRGILDAAFDLRAARSRQNWTITRTAIQGAKQYGFSPGFDTAMALGQAFYREVSPETGPISDFYAAAIVMGGLTIKRGFDIRGGIPFVSSLAATGMYNAKTFTEDAIGYMFGNLEALRAGKNPNIGPDARAAIGLAGQARGQGIFTPPGLRNLMATTPADAENLPIATRRLLQQFSSGMFRTLSTDNRNALIQDIETGLADIETVVKPFYTLVDANGDQIFSKAELDTLKANMTLNLGQLSGMGFLLSVQRQRQAEQGSMRVGQLLSFNRKVGKALEDQKASELQIAGMVAASEALDAQIMRLKGEDVGRLTESEQLARSLAIQNLEKFAGTFRNASKTGRRHLNELIQADARAAQATIDELTQPENAKFLDRAFVSGELDSLLARVGLAQRQSEISGREAAASPNTTSGMASDFVEITSEQLAKRRKIELVEDRLAAAVSLISEASVKALDNGRPLQDAVEISKKQSTMLQQIVSLERAQSDLIIEDAYSKISTDITIPVASFGNSLDEMFRLYENEQTGSFLSLVNASTLKSITLGGKSGERMYDALNSAAARSIDRWYNTMPEEMSRAFKKRGYNFVDGPTFREWMKEQIVFSDEAVAKALKIESGSQMTDMQLAYYLTRPNRLKITAEDLQMVTSPLELETLRQSANKMLFSGNDKSKELGSKLLEEVDRAFENWATTTGSVDEFNQVIVARTVYRAEQLRFEGKGTLGGLVESVNVSKQITGEADPERNLSFILKPFVSAITDPKFDSASIIQTELKKVINTIAPVSHSLIEQKLVQQLDETGKYVPIGDDDLAKLAVRTVDLDTFMVMKAVLGNAVRNSFYGASDMSRVKSALDRGLIPGLVEGDAPKRITVPNEYEGNVQQYLRDISEASVMTVETVDGPKQMQLLDMEDLLMSDRQITEVVNAIPEFRQAHADLLTLAKNAQEDLDAAQSLRRQDAETMAKVEESLPDSFRGQGFVNNVMNSNAPDQSVVFLQQLQTSKAYKSMSPEKQGEAMQSLFVDTIKYLGGYGPSTRTVKLFTGDTVTTGAYNNPAEVFSVLDDALTGNSVEGIALKRLADAANVDKEQLETLHALFRYSVRIDQTDLMARKADNKLTSVTKGFTLDNALSKAFNLARGMVSKEYVMAEVAIRYAALARGKSLDFLLSDKKSAGIVKQLLEDEALVADEDAYYFATQLMKFVADEIPRGMTNLDVTSNPYLEEYYISAGVLQPVDVGRIVFNQ